MRDYLVYAKVREQVFDTGDMDLGSVKFLTPTTLLPLSITVRKSHGTFRMIPPPDPNVQDYLEFMMDNYGIARLNKQTYLPIVGLPENEVDSQPILKKIYQLGGDIGGKNAFRYLVGELVDNIYQHSSFKNALVMAQKYQRKDVMQLCIIDDGITIAGSLRLAGIDLEDDQAIVDALQGASSKKDRERGKGLGTSLKLMMEGYRGKMLVVSGRGAVHYQEGNPIKYRLSDKFKYEGTLISMVIPLIDKEVNVYDYANL